jgi:SAM-dependent methyltransferase
MRWHKDSRFDASELWMASHCPTSLLDAVIAEWNPQSCLDVGCGTGQTLRFFLEKGIDSLGLEGSRAAIEASPVKDHILCVNLNTPVNVGRRFDLVWSFEVAEHIHPRFVGRFVETLTKHGDLVVMSAAQPGQGGAGHFNEQPPSYWINKLQEHAFTVQRRFTEYLHGMKDLHSKNVMVFLRNRRG